MLGVENEAALLYFAASWRSEFGLPQRLFKRWAKQQVLGPDRDR
jgi:hypothetical protein